MDDASKNEQETVSQGKPGLFEPGGPGGPGRPAGSRNKATLALDKIADDAGEAILAMMIEAAKGGDQRAAEIVLARVWPVRKGRPVSLDLPAITCAADVVAALGTVAESVAGGALTPDEGQAVAAVLEIERKAIETLELEGRIAALEQERK